MKDEFGNDVYHKMANYKMHRPQGSTCGLFLANSLFVNSVFMNIIKKIVKKLLNNNNSLLCMVKMEYNGRNMSKEACIC